MRTLPASVSVSSLYHWFNDPAHWHGVNGVPHRLVQHVELSVVAVGIACLAAIPIGLVLGHLGKGGLVALNLANVGRAIPSLAILIIAVPIVGIGAKPAYVALIALAIPPILTNTYVAVREVNGDVKDAARGMGMTGAQMISRVELRLAMPLILAGVRISAFQVIATATLAAEVAAGGLGRYIVDGFAVRDDTQIFAGALVVVLLAFVVEAMFAGLQRALVPSALRRPRSFNPDPRLEDITHETLEIAA